MTDAPKPTAVRDAIPTRSLGVFLLITFGIAWGLVGLFLLAPATLASLFGPVSAHHPLFILAVYAPAIAALVLVARHGGTAGLRAFLSRLLWWRCPPAGYALLLAGIPAVYLLASLPAGTLAAHAPLAQGAGALAAAMAFMLVLGPVEEIGWRGYALPLLQRRLAPLWAGVVLGVVWGLWHLPAFFLAGTPQSAWPFAPFFLGAVAVSVLVTVLFNAARGSLLLPVLFHFQLNNPLWPDAQPWDMALFALLALAVVAWQDPALWRRGGVTVVVPAPSPGAVQRPPLA